jgi:hypothetical protein
VITFYMDVHVPRAITEQLRLRGIDVLTAQQDGTTELEDAELLDRVLALTRVVFAQDQDFLLIAAEWQDAGHAFAGIVFAEQHRVSIGQCVADLELIGLAGSPADFLNTLVRVPL